MSLNLPQFCLVGREKGKKRKKLKLEIRDICRIVARDSFSVLWEKDKKQYMRLLVSISIKTRKW